MRAMMMVVLLSGCESAAVLALAPLSVDGGAVGLAPPVAADLTHDLPPPADMAQLPDLVVPPDLTERHFVCIGRKCQQSGQWCADYGEGLGCDEQTGWTYCALAGTECHRDAECCTRRVGNGFAQTCAFGRCR